MSSIRGWPDQRKKSEQKAEHVTVSPVRNYQHGLDVVSHETVQTVASDTVEAGSTTKVINATGHSAEVGDVITFSTGALAPRDVHVESVEANAITVVEELPSAPGTGDGFDIKRFTYPTLSVGGVTQTQMAFIRDAANQVVTEDTVTPANNRPLPVKLTDFSGDMVLNATNLGLEVQLDHSGADPDSVQVGDGTNTLGVNADGSLPVGNASGAFDTDSGVEGAQTLRTTPATDAQHLLNTRHEAATTPLSSRLSDGSAFLGSDFGASSTALRSAALLGNASGLADFGSGTVSAQTLRNAPATDATHLLDTRHEAVGTPLSGRLSDGSNFLDSEALAAAQKTISTLTAALANISVVLGWDGSTHREFAVNTSGQIQTESQTTAATFQAGAQLAGTSLTGTHQTLITASADSVNLLLLNSTDEDITISLDGGTTDHYFLSPGQSFSLELANQGRHIANGTVIQVKHDGTAPSTGRVVATLVS